MTTAAPRRADIYRLDEIRPRASAIKSFPPQAISPRVREKWTAGN
jgi:hypothetical protein